MFSVAAAVEPLGVMKADGRATAVEIQLAAVACEAVQTWSPADCAMTGAASSATVAAANPARRREPVEPAVGWRGMSVMGPAYVRNRSSSSAGSSLRKLPGRRADGGRRDRRVSFSGTREQAHWRVVPFFLGLPTRIWKQSRTPGWRTTSRYRFRAVPRTRPAPTTASADDFRDGTKAAAPYRGRLPKTGTFRTGRDCRRATISGPALARSRPGRRRAASRGMLWPAEG